MLRAGWSPVAGGPGGGEAVLAVSGSALVLTEVATLVVPAGCGAILPADSGSGVMTAADPLSAVVRVPLDEAPVPPVPAVTVASDFARMLAAETTAAPAGDSPRRSAAAGLLREELARGRPGGFTLAEPADLRLGRVTRQIWVTPAAPLTVNEAAALAIMSRRTFTRHFGLQTGFGFDAWQRRLRLLTVVPRLEQGVQVTQVAGELGYDSVSAFIAAFRRAFGTTPRRFGRSAVRASALAG
ncbi:helix-turn-helix domain-containing protein [Caenispirillum bisanense]|uniref:helix-turn-helix domain-containing protein n=1 Tax=Caenispirillum bisanense TaxID=414052 RepID=UPI0015967C28|nr:AraC family transcriptional regulator [Caenispirillum bisanense]